MKANKIKIIRLLITALTVITFTGCNARKTDLTNKTKILCATFPQYDWTMNIIGENFNATTLSMLIKNGVDMHSYQPTAADIIAISSCNLLIYTGGESEQWIRDTLNSPECAKVRSICLMDILNNKLQEDAFEDKTESEDEIEYDEHVWLSVKNAEYFCKEITKVLQEMLPELTENFDAHLNAYMKNLETLDMEYQMTLDGAPSKTVIICDRYPFKYLFTDYDITCFAAFPGCSSETEASFETVAFLASKLDENQRKAVFKIDNSKDKLCQTVISSSKSPLTDVYTLNSMQATTLRDSYMENTYISIMRDNLNQLRDALYPKESVGL
ncbi:MAG: metal ABC transporter substrate-binding protein [Treponema sp.]|nr:metal ABC transporter substrate-binding protein [Treponema sp.]